VAIFSFAVRTAKQLCRAKGSALLSPRKVLLYFAVMIFVFLFFWGYSCELLNIRIIDVAEPTFLSIITVKDMKIGNKPIEQNVLFGVSYIPNQFAFPFIDISLQNMRRLTAANCIVISNYGHHATIYGVKIGTVLFKELVAQRHFVNTRTGSAQVGNFERVSQVIPAKYFIFAQGHPSITRRPMPLIAELIANGNKFGYEPSAFAIDHGVGLPLNGPQGTESRPNARYSNGDQRPIRDQSVQETIPYRLEWLVLGTIVFWSGCWLAYLGGYRRRYDGWGWTLLSFLLMFFGLGFLLADNTDRKPKQNSEGYNWPSHHRNTVLQQYPLTVIVVGRTNRNARTEREEGRTATVA
jgi:hypothetical protein